MDNSEPRSWLRALLEPLKPTFREVLAISLFVNILALAVPIFTLQVYDRVIFSAGLSTLQGLVLGMGLVLIFDYVLRQARARIMQTVALRVDVLVGRKLFNKLMALPLQTLESRPSSHWTSLFRDVDVVRNTLSGASAVLLADLPFVVLFLGLVFVIATPIAWVLLVVLPVFLYVAWRSGAVMSAANQMERQSGMSRDAMISEMINGRATIKALALDRAMRPIWEERHADNIENAVVRGSKADSYSNLGSTLTMMTTVSLTSIGAIAIINHSMTMGALIATNMLSGRILGPLNQLVGSWRTYTTFKQSVERLSEVFASESERQESEIALDRPKGDLSIENVSFAYEDGEAPVIDKVQLTIEAGGVHALVGRNGSGKTTLLKLIQGLYGPTDGRVLLDGADIAQFTRSELADWMGYVPQDCILFEGSVRDNVAHRHPDADDETVIKASTAAGVHQFIIDLPDGYATEIGEAGRRLSGGQRQRIAIARALVGDPPVLLLDEPSASLDRQAETELRKTITEFGRERTVIVVTHSPILLAACDKLVALDRGRVALAGPASEILPKLLGTPGKSAAKDQPRPPGGVPPKVPQGARPRAAPRPEARPPRRPPSKPAADAPPQRRAEATQKRTIKIPPSGGQTPSPAEGASPGPRPPSQAERPAPDDGQNRQPAPGQAGAPDKPRVSGAPAEQTAGETDKEPVAEGKT